MQNAIDLMNWVRYMAQIVVNGDYSNEWIQEMPPDVVECVYMVGKWVSQLLGYS